MITFKRELDEYDKKLDELKSDVNKNNVVEVENMYFKSGVSLYQNKNELHNIEITFKKPSATAFVSGFSKKEAYENCKKLFAE